MVEFSRISKSLENGQMIEQLCCRKKNSIIQYPLAGKKTAPGHGVQSPQFSTSIKEKLPVNKSKRIFYAL